jgi:hypothetical protein
MKIDAGTWAAIAIATVTVITGLSAMFRFMVIHYLNELKPNSGSSLKDAVCRLESRVDELFKLIAEKM